MKNYLEYQGVDVTSPRITVLAKINIAKGLIGLISDELIAEKTGLYDILSIKLKYEFEVEEWIF